MKKTGIFALLLLTGPAQFVVAATGYAADSLGFELVVTGILALIAALMHSFDLLRKYLRRHTH